MINFLLTLLFFAILGAMIAFLVHRMNNSTRYFLIKYSGSKTGEVETVTIVGEASFTMPGGRYINRESVIKEIKSSIDPNKMDVENTRIFIDNIIELGEKDAIEYSKKTNE